MNFKKTFLGKFLRYLLVSFKKLLHLRDSTHEIALGFAIGVVIGILPTFGFGIVILGLLALVIRFNFIAAFTGSLINSPIFVPFWLASSYKIGEIITKIGIDLQRNNLVKNIFDFSVSYLVGNIVLSIILGIASYFIVFLIIEAYRSTKRGKN
ncbi:MAG: DUF2062 domain-containing protein [Brevinematia bacterium]